MHLIKNNYLHDFCLHLKFNPDYVFQKDNKNNNLIHLAIKL